jgi:hypothetical protein
MIIDLNKRTPSPLVKSLDKRLDKLDKFHVLQSTSQLERKPMRERGIAWTWRFDLNHRPPGLNPVSHDGIGPR